MPPHTNIKVGNINNPDEQIWKVMVPDEAPPRSQHELDREMDEMIERGEE